MALSYEMGYEDTVNMDFIAQMSQKIPCLVDVKPVGSHYLTALEEVGGVPALLGRLAEHLTASV